MRRIDGYTLERLKSVEHVTVNIELRSLRAAVGVPYAGNVWRIIHSEIWCSRGSRREGQHSHQGRPSKAYGTEKEELVEGIDRYCCRDRERRGEMLNLRWRDVDLPQKTITIQSSKGFRAKGGKDRIIPMSERVHALLSRKAGRSSCEYLLSTRGARIVESFLPHRIKKYVRQAGFDEHSHSLRHTNASWHVQDGVSVYEAQKLLDHSSSSVTEVNSHLQPEQLQDIVNRSNIATN